MAWQVCKVLAKLPEAERKSRVMCIDTHDELTAAWRALIAAGFPPEATAITASPRHPASVSACR